MCQWAPPYFPGLESMAARKNGVYLADEHGGCGGSEVLVASLWRSFHITTEAAVLPSGTPRT